MTALESLMLTVLLLTCGYATYTDFKTGLIPNKIILVSGSTALLLDVLYYLIFQRELILGFLLNFGVISFFSILLYAYSFWGAGDSKLMMLAGLTIPARFYSSGIYNISLITIIVQTFAIAFVYLMAESLVLGIIRKDLFSVRISKKFNGRSLKGLVMNYLVSYIYIMFFGFGISLFLSGHPETNPYITPLFNFFIVFTVLNFSFFKKVYVIGTIAVADAVLMFIFRTSLPSAMPPAWNLILITVVLLFRCFAEKYNYQTIRTSDVSKGMVLSFASIMQLSLSQEKGLPQTTTEDFRSRITEKEAESIRRWGELQKNNQEITIVKKMPFAVFITLGIVTFLGLRMWINC